MRSLAPPGTLQLAALPPDTQLIPAIHLAPGVPPGRLSVTLPVPFEPTQYKYVLVVSPTGQYFYAKLDASSYARSYGVIHF